MNRQSKIAGVRSPRVLPTDAGALIALINPDETAYPACWRVVQQKPNVTLLTTAICFQEALYRLEKVHSRTLALRLWNAWESGFVRLHPFEESDAARCLALMQQYDFADFGDASLVALCENIGAAQVFTLDKHFYAYRLADGSALQVMPEGVG